MRPPSRRIKAYECLKHAILSGFYGRGVFLPNENQLSQEYGVARETLRSALTLLEAEGLIERLRSRGTRVCGQPLTPLTFLLPCPDFFSGNDRTASFLKARQLLNGISRAAYENHRRIDPVPLSPRNRPDEIDFRALAHLNAESLVVVNSCWAHELLFPFLEQLGCRVAIRIGETERPHTMPFHNRWLIQVEDNHSLISDAVDFLARSGCRKIGIAYWFNLFAEGHPILRAFREAVMRHGMSPDCCRAFAGNDDRVSRQEMEAFYQEHQFDGLLLAPLLQMRPRYDLHFNTNYALPTSVKIVTLLDTEDNVCSFPPISSFNYPSEKIGCDAALRLLQPDWMPGEIFYTAELINRNS